MNWQRIEIAPPEKYINSRRVQILCAFKTPNSESWIYFVYDANGPDTQLAGYSKPEIWTEILTPNRDS